MRGIKTSKGFKRKVGDNQFKVTFIKKTTGENRVMNGTLNLEMIQEVSDWKPSENAKPETNDKIVKIFDLDKMAWRSLDVEYITDLVVN